MIIDITEKNYDEYVTNSNSLVILDFGATNCGPCKILNNILEEIESENENITVGKINIEESTDLAIKFGVMTVPTMVILKDNKTIQKVNGLKDKEFIQNLINNI
ncbi:thioredoxin domain-containing protein [uncultured Tyzzerella sp.]|uniref:thioredoxin family protein n=1 Tax=uncultured Tyzzerella sp. TaxID=2321398 RepID=UPI0029425D7E|nr:thioredoxin domain-containing protein [uncultured Tyzzerella sp.]